MFELPAVGDVFDGESHLLKRDFAVAVFLEDFARRLFKRAEKTPRRVAGMALACIVAIPDGC